MITAITELEKIKFHCQTHIELADTIITLAGDHKDMQARKKEYEIKKECYKDTYNMCRKLLTALYDELDKQSEELKGGKNEITHIED